MNNPLSENTKAILLLTAPLILEKRANRAELLRPSEYQKLARHLLDLGKQPSDFLSAQADEVIEKCRLIIDADRIKRLLDRGFLLGQVVERWQARSIWVVSRADPDYPRLFKSKMKERAPAIIYGCGDVGHLNQGGLAVVGSRQIDSALASYAENVGALAARAKQTVISGGAKGVDRAAMDGALKAGGNVIGVLAEDLEREAMDRKNREALRSGKLLLISEYDPCSHFTIAHAMQRNGLIYALADHALVVNAELERGGTWAGAIEQLERLHFSTVFVRSSGEPNLALDVLRERGALPWPNPTTPDELVARLCAVPGVQMVTASGDKGRPLLDSAAADLLQKVRDILQTLLKEPRGEEEVADVLRITLQQAREWLVRMVEEGWLKRAGSPVRYFLREPEPSGLSKQSSLQFTFGIDKDG